MRNTRPVVPRDLVAGIEARPVLPDGRGDERFAGYAVLGVRFASGDILALRRYAAASVERAYTSVWHRSPARRWTIYQDIEPGGGCGRYFSAAVDTVVMAPTRIIWTGADRFTVAVDGGETIDWEVRLTGSRLTRVLSRVVAALPSRLLDAPATARGIGALAGTLLGAGTLTFAGRTPNGFCFVARPADLWLVSASRAMVGGCPTGEAIRSAADARLGDFRIPARGVFAMTRASLRSADPAVAGFSRA